MDSPEIPQLIAVTSRDGRRRRLRAMSAPRLQQNRPKPPISRPESLPPPVLRPQDPRPLPRSVSRSAPQSGSMASQRLSPVPPPRPFVRGILRLSSRSVSRSAPRQELIPSRHPAPRLALIFPCHVSGAELVRRSVLALHSQTAAPDIFEVVVAADGGDPDGVIRRAVEPGDHPFQVTLVESPRPRGSLPHRNHARNAGWRAARAPLCWILDADLILEPEAVEHALAVHDVCLSKGQPAVFSLVLSAIRTDSPEAWLERSEDWARTGDVEVFARLIAETGVGGGVYSGFHEFYVQGPPDSRLFPDLPEGMPLLWRGLLEALGGFDESFVGWGGNKEELIDRLKGLERAGLFDIRLLTSIRALHQPHEHDALVKKARGRGNQLERERRWRLIQGESRWWRGQLRRVRRLLPAAIEAARVK